MHIATEERSPLPAIVSVRVTVLRFTAAERRQMARTRDMLSQAEDRLSEAIGREAAEEHDLRIKLTTAWGYIDELLQEHNGEVSGLRI